MNLPSTQNELLQILAQRRLHVLFQPIVQARQGRILGFEALVRGPSDSPLHAPLTLFAAATHFRREAELEMLCCEMAVQSFARQRLKGLLFLNLAPGAILQPEFRMEGLIDCLYRTGLSPEQVVVELSEHTPIADFHMMRGQIARFREYGLGVAIDDLGAGYAGMSSWREPQPDLLKLTTHFIQNIENDPAKRKFVKSVCEAARAHDIRVVAEGVETPEALEQLLALEVDLLQGNLLARPEARPARQVDSALFNAAAPRALRQATDLVASITQECEGVPPQTRVEDTAALFHRNPTQNSLVVMSEGRPVGIVSRSQILNLYTSRYGRDLYGRRSITSIMRSDVVMVPHDMPLEEVSLRITDEYNQLPEEDIIVVDQAGHLLGIATLVGLLKGITQQQVQAARHANPLTQLPGNVPINHQIDRLLAAGDAFVVAYCDLDNFKPFNDHYGYVKGDDVLRRLSQVLVSHMDEQDFVGHVGGDDFILLLQSEDWEQRCQAILAQFEREVLDFYPEQDRAQGGIEAVDRRGNRRLFPFLSLSIGAVQAHPGVHLSHQEIAALATEVKSEAKRLPGNSLFVDRRRPTPDLFADLTDRSETELTH